jgi:RNA polymerase sigma-70 factor (sigma-E family)
VTLTGHTVVTVDFADYAGAHRATLVRSAVLLGCSAEEAEDLVQVTLTKCFQHWTKVARADRPDAYVYRVLVNALRDSRSRRWRGETPTEEPPELPVVEFDPTDGLAIRGAIAALPKPYREVLVLRYYSDLSERETARVLGLPAGTVKSRTARALTALSHDPTIARSS